MTLRKTVAISAAIWLLVFNTVSAQDEWDALDGEDEEESDDESAEDETPPDQAEPESFPDQARDDEGFVEPFKNDEGTGETSGEGEQAPLPAKVTKEDKPISVGLLVGYGISFEDSELNPFGLGFGLRGGYTFDIGLYAGAKFIYYLGGELGTQTANIATISVEGGYKLVLDPVVFVPSLELGLAILSIEDTGSILSADESSTEFYLAPGLSILFPFDMFFIGVDLSIPIILKDPTVNGFSIMATGGLLF